MYHITKDKQKIPIEKLETNHLINIIKLIEKKAKEGIKIQNGGGTTAEDMWYDEYKVYGQKVYALLNYKKYTDELNKRKISKI